MIKTTKKMTRSWKTSVTMTKLHKTLLIRSLLFPASAEDFSSDIWPFDEFP
jgi:hypothetical protein